MTRARAGLMLLLALAAVPAFPATGVAETVVHLRDGSVVHGELVEEKDGVLTIRATWGTVSIPLDRVSTIEVDGAPSAAGTPATATATPAAPSPSPSPSPSTPVPESPPRIPLIGETLALSIGWHGYSGPGWSTLPANRFNAAAFELEMAKRERELGPIFLSASATAGYYGGRSSLRDSAGNALTVGFENVHVDVGPRGEVDASDRFSFFLEPGVGVYDSVATLSGSGVSSRQNRVTPALYATAGVAISITRAIRVHVAEKSSRTFGRFPHASADLAMGGNTLLVGADLRR